MTVLNQLYFCPLCGNVIEVVFTGAEALVCCDEPMQLLKEDSVDAAREKHVPVIEGNQNSITVKVGSVPHPMLKEHYIAFIEVITTDNMVLRAELKPGDKPEAVFPVTPNKVAYAREYCNLHKLWKTA